MSFLQLFRRWLSILPFGLLLHTAGAIAVEPAQLEFEARLDEPTLLSLQVALGEIAPKNFTADIDGFACDRRIIPLDDNKFLIQIAPDTVMAGNVSGKVVLKNDGNPLGEPIPVKGAVLPWLKVRPSKLFFASIGHGKQFETPQTYKLTLTSDGAPFDITSVEFPGIPGASWKSEPGPGVSALSKNLNVTFSLDALATGMPFGALTRKFILIKTTHPQAFFLSVPTTGLISVNTSGRNYNEYLYKGEPRWQGAWGTPNIAAAFLSMMVILICGIACCLHKIAMWHRWVQAILMVIAFPAMGWGCFHLVRTYSRGGWVAMAGGIVVLLVGIRKPRFYPIALAGLFAAFIATNPAGFSRALSTAEVSSDKSISHRLLLWQGAFQMMAEHPWTGVGAGKFGDVFTRDYQLPTHTQSYSTAINDFLTLGTERGVPLLVFVTSAFLTLVGIGLGVGMKTKNTFLVSCAATIFCGLISSGFSSIAFQSDSTWLLVAASGGVALGLLWQQWWKGGSQRSQRSGNFLRRWAANIADYFKDIFGRLVWPGVLAWIVVTVFLVSVLLIAGLVTLRAYPEVSQWDINGIQGLRVNPRWQASKGTIVYLGDRGEQPKDLVKNTLRPLARKGWTVLCFEQPKYASDASDQITAMLKQLFQSDPEERLTCIAGHRQGAVVALQVGSRQGAMPTACYMLPASWPHFDLSPHLQLTNSQQPLLLCAQEADPVRSAQHLLALNQIAESRINFQKQVHPGEFRRDNKDWMLWIEAIDAFGQKSILN